LREGVIIDGDNNKDEGEYNHLKLTKIDHDTRQKLTEIMKEIVKIEITNERLEGALNNINYKQTLKTIELMH
jgi:hypothetical protein